VPIVRKPAKRYRCDAGYKRTGAANLFVMAGASRSRRKVRATGRRASEDFAACMRGLVDPEYPGAGRIRGVTDTLSTHTASAACQTFPAAEARRILRRLELRYTPRPASWPSMAGAGTGVMRRQRLDRRIDDRNARWTPQ